MFRSLFIGFLILSALTPKGAGAQIIKSDLNISADKLLELFNSVSVRTGMTTEFTAVQAKRSDGAYISSDNGAADSRQNGLKQFSPAALFEQSDWTHYALQGDTVFQEPVPYIGTRFFFYVSGLSPPDC